MLGHLLVQVASRSIHSDPIVLQMQWGVLNLGEVAAGGMPSFDKSYRKIDCLPNCLLYLECVVMGDGLFGFSDLVLDKRNSVVVISPFSKSQHLEMSSLTVATLSTHDQIDLQHNLPFLHARVLGNDCSFSVLLLHLVEGFSLMVELVYHHINWIMKMILLSLLISVLLLFGSVLTSQFSHVLFG